METQLHALRGMRCMMYDENDKPGFSKKHHSEDRFRKPAFFIPEKRRLRVDGRLKRRKNISVFKRIRIRAFFSKFLREFL